MTEKIIGCAFRVYNTMGFGFLESVYEKCLLIELKQIGLRVEAQHPVSVYYRRELAGVFVADVIVEDLVILELKSVHQVHTIHEAQLVNYLTATGIKVGLIINFAKHKVEIKRKVRELETD